MEESTSNSELGNNETNTNESKSYSQNEVLALIQSEADKRVAQALKKQAKEYDKKLSLSGLDDVQRKQAEKDIRISELEEQLKEFNSIQTKAEITKVLGARGLNTEFADLISIGDDMEAAQQKIDKLDTLFKQSVKIEVEKRIGSNTPKVSTTGLDGSVTKEQFAKMNLQQKTELYKNNEKLYEELTKK